MASHDVASIICLGPTSASSSCLSSPWLTSFWSSRTTIVVGVVVMVMDVRSAPKRYLMQWRNLNLKAKYESSTSHLSFKRLLPGARRFQHGSDRVNLHNHTLTGTMVAETVTAAEAATTLEPLKEMAAVPTASV